MTDIKVFKKDKWYQRIVAEGHADLSEKGKDILCAGISVLLQSIIIYMIDCEIELNEENYKESMLGGLLDLDIRNADVKGNDIFINEVIHATLLTLEQLEEQYPENLKINYIEL